MRGGPNRTPALSPPMRIGQALKNNQSITYSQTDSPIHGRSQSPYGAQIYLHSSATQQPNPQPQQDLVQKYFMLCMQLQRLSKQSAKHQTLIFNLTQQIQIRITDTQSFRQREGLLQRQLKKIQEDDKTLLQNYHKLEQVLLEKNRLTGMLEEELVMMRSKMGSIEAKGGRDNFEDKNRIRDLEENLNAQKSKNFQLDRQCKEAVINLERAQARMNTKLGTDRNLLLNAENRIKDLEEQLRVYVAKIRLLEENQIRFSQQNKLIEQVKYMQVMREVEELRRINGELLGERGKSAEIQRQIESYRAQVRMKAENENQYQRQILLLEEKLSKMNDVISQKQKRLILMNIQKTQLQYRVQSAHQQMKRLEQRNSQYIAPACKICSHLLSQNQTLLSKLQRVQQLIRTQQRQYRIIIQKSQKQMKNLRDLLQSVHNLKGSNQRVERLIEVSASKLMRASSNKGFFSGNTF